MFDNNAPDGFKQLDDTWRNYFLFEPNIYVGVEVLTYSLTSQDSQFLGGQTISTKQQIACPAKGNDMK